jgi:8-oxo-dGTP pyrophosphatase MutT (NUDIX family)
MRQQLGATTAVEFPDGSAANVELWHADELLPEVEVFAAMVVLRDGAGRCAVAWSPRRQEWGIPGGAREPGETVAECAVREVDEETGVLLDEAALIPSGFERFTPVTDFGRWPAGGGSMQLFRAQVTGTPDLRASFDDAVDPQWVTVEEFEARAGHRFWWPMVAAAIRVG